MCACQSCQVTRKKLAIQMVQTQENAEPVPSAALHTCTLSKFGTAPVPASCCNLWNAGQADPSNAMAWPEMESACFRMEHISSESNLIGPDGPVKRMQVVPNFTTWKKSTCLPPWTPPSPQQCEPSSVKDSCADLRPTCRRVVLVFWHFDLRCCQCRSKTQFVACTRL